MNLNHALSYRSVGYARPQAPAAPVQSTPEARPAAPHAAANEAQPAAPAQRTLHAALSPDESAAIRARFPEGAGAGFRLYGPRAGQTAAPAALGSRLDLRG